MTNTTAGLKRKIESATDLHSVVRTMKAMAASNIGQYENAANALEDYYRTVQLGLTACFRHLPKTNGALTAHAKPPANIVAIVFGSDQGLVGQFNEVMVEYVVKKLRQMPGNKTVWSVGERVHSRLAETDLTPRQSFVLPSSITTITPLVGCVLEELDTQSDGDEMPPIYLFYNRPSPESIYVPVSQQLLPMDDKWRQELTQTTWPSKNLPQVLNQPAKTLLAFVREYLFVSLFRACAESLASENASRLAAMQRAEKNIDELLEDLTATFRRVRQSRIDEELFDVVSGFEALENS